VSAWLVRGVLLVLGLLGLGVGASILVFARRPQFPRTRRPYFRRRAAVYLVSGAAFVSAGATRSSVGVYVGAGAMIVGVPVEWIARRFARD
jgi:hypothetical protein